MKTPDQPNPNLKQTTPESVQTPLTGREGLDLLKASMAKVPGIRLIEFLKTPEGQQMLKCKKIILAGPPKSGKSCTRQGLKDVMKDVIRQTGDKDLYPYFITACPDGEGAWFQESMNANPDLAAKLKAEYKSKFTPAHAKVYAEWVKNLSAPHSPLNFVDIGGIISSENEMICKDANGAILICGETATKGDAPIQWKKFFTELGIPVVAEMYSDYKGKEDLVDGAGEDGVFRGSVHHLERGENLTDRKAIQELAKFIIDLGKEK